jgi:hypothetical protein
MTPDDLREDPVLAALAGLRTHDVGRPRARRLRLRCHAVLKAHERRSIARSGTQPGVWRRAAGPALAGGWCILYLFEIIRQAVATYRM